MKNLIALTIGAGLLAGCTTSGDGRLTIFAPSVATEYQISGAPGTFVGCDNLLDSNGAVISSKTQVRVRFTSSGFVSSLKVGLVGETTNTLDPNFVLTVTPTTGLRRDGNTNNYTVYFDAGADRLLPASNGAGLAAQSIVVSPAVVTIKNVSVRDSDRVTGNNGATLGGFRASLNGTSDTGSNTGEIRSAPAIAVYTNCTLVSDTGTQL